jgi:glyoxylase-like metal-dependent hydrolase (beta-lactamase superfamily II)
LVSRRIHVLERGWLSCNNILVHGVEGTTLVDSSYGAQGPQTLALLEHALGGRGLARLVNTHCHSDHMGGNRAVQDRYRCRTTIPAGEAPLVDAWDDRELMLGFADQHAERFDYDDTLAPGDTIRMGDLDWQAIAAPGHDAHALMFYAPEERVLIAGDALWEDGFGVIFPALFGDTHAVADTRATLDTIARLDLRTVIPGHGAPFDRVLPALERAYSRLEGFERDLARLARHCAKVMLVFALLDKRRMPIAAVPAYCEQVGILRHLNQEFLRMTPQAFADWLVADLERARAIAREDGDLVPLVSA